VASLCDEQTISDYQKVSESGTADNGSRITVNLPSLYEVQKWSNGPVLELKLFLLN